MSAALTACGREQSRQTGAAPLTNLLFALQRKVDPSRSNVMVLNFSVPGYGLREVFQFLKNKDGVYHVHEVIYLLNPNDFAWRDTRFEGADNDLYRMYRNLVVASSLFVRKMVYRWHKTGWVTPKNEVLVSPAWYQWMYDGNRERGFEVLRELKLWTDHVGVRLTVVPLPAGCAYGQGGTFALDEMFDQIDVFLKANGIAYADIRALFAQSPTEYFESTDHLVEAGNRVMTAGACQTRSRVAEPP